MVIALVFTKSLSTSRRIPVLSRERYDRKRPSTTRLISEGDLIDLLSKLSVYIFFYFVRKFVAQMKISCFNGGKCIFCEVIEKCSSECDRFFNIIENSLVTI